MDKWRFKEVLKKHGYSVDDDPTPTVLLVGEPEKVKETFIKVKMLAKSVGYNHTIRVKNLEVNDGGYENE